MTKQSKSWSDVLDVHPAANLFPRMAERELRELGNNIREHGLVSPIAIFKEVGTDGVRYSLLDGINRLNAMEMAGIKFEFKLSKSGATASFPFNLDGGYVRGLDLSQRDHFYVADYDGDGIADICAEIETYNGEPEPLEPAVKAKYGISKNYVVIACASGTRVRDHVASDCTSR